MRLYISIAGLILCLVSLNVAAEPATVNPDDVAALFKTLDAPGATESPRVLYTSEGFLRFVGAPPGGYFDSGVFGAKANDPEAISQAFIEKHKGAFFSPSSNVEFSTDRVKTTGGTSYVRLNQTYGGYSVFGAQMVVQTDSDGQIACVVSDVLLDPATLDDGSVSLTGAIGIEEAKSAAIAWVVEEYETTPAGLFAADTSRVIFDPAVVGETGDTRFVWKTSVFQDGELPGIGEVVFVDAHTGSVVFHYSLLHNAKIRSIYDMQNTYLVPDDAARTEGQDPTGIEDVDSAYDYLGDTYDFYYNVHGRDSIDGEGMMLRAFVRICHPYYGCPVQNAFYLTRDNVGFGFPTDIMAFGDGFVVDDITAHELTHGVTSYESDLVYANASGAINESFSDIWGEFVDLTNGAGNDSDEVRWLMGEDVALTGALRSMKDPTLFGDPDRLGSPYYYSGSLDQGGVHTNCGVGNKLCYLLTDGDSFNNEDVEGMGIERTAKLFYELQVDLLPSSADWNDLYMTLGQATVNQDYTFEERLNVLAAARAVEIAPTDDASLLRNFRATPTYDDATDGPAIALSWVNPTSGEFTRLILARSTEGYPLTPEQGTEIYRGRDEDYLDTDVEPGTEYYYALFLDVAAGFPQSEFAHADPGTQVDFLNEVYSDDESPIDLSFSQVTYIPCGAPVGDVGSERIPTQFADYTATIEKGIYELPVAREDKTAGEAFSMLMTDDGYAAFSTVIPFTFFNSQYSRFYVHGNGYIAFEPVALASVANFPFLATHYSMPRISFLFADLVPTSTGEVWGRVLSDRIVVTFEQVPEYRSSDDHSAAGTNTVQVELFFSGHIRMTYLELNVSDAICGLSDGQGVPVDPADLFLGARSVPLSTDLSELPEVAPVLTIAPIAAQVVDAGALIDFTATAEGPSGVGTAALSAEWTGDGTAPFGDNHDGTGTFYWASEPDDAGLYTVRIIASLNGEVTFQDVLLAVGDVFVAPTAANVELSTGDPVEDPSRDRAVDDDVELVAEYDYVHPYAATQPDVYAEGEPHIFWFRDSALMPAYTNVTVVPPYATKPGDTWFFTIIPKTVSGIEGEEVQSPIVTIIGLPAIYNVALPDDLPADIDPDDLPLPNISVPSIPSTGGDTLVILGYRLDVISQITIGGVEVQSYSSISDYRVEVVAPAHAPSELVSGVPVPEDVVVVTPYGSALLQSAVTFADSGEDIIKADVNSDGTVNAVDVQMVVNAVLEIAEKSSDTDVNRDGKVDSVDVQAVVNEALSQ